MRVYTKEFIALHDELEDLLREIQTAQRLWGEAELNLKNDFSMEEEQKGRVQLLILNQLVQKWETKLAKLQQLNQK